MDNRSTTHDAHAPVSVLEGVPEDDETLEQRIRRLENAIAALSDTSLMEARLVQKFKTEIEPVARTSRAGHERSFPETAAAGLSLLNRVSSALRPTNWLIVEILSDLKDSFGMYFDSRYRKTATFQLMLPMLLGAFIFSQLLLSSLVGKVVDVFIILLAYKVMMREVERYRELIGPLERHG